MSSLYAERPTPFGLREFVKVLACGLILVIGQAAMSALAGLSGYGPEWMLPLALYVALRSELWMAALAAFILGFFRDAAGGLLLGLWAFTLVMLVWLFYPYRSRLNFFNPLTLTPLVFILALAGYLFIMTPIMAILGWPGGGFNPLPGFFVSSLVTALTSPPLFVFLRWLCKGGTERN